MKKLRVTVEGKTYEVLVETLDAGPAAAAPVPVSAPVAAPVVAPSAPSAAPKGPSGPGEVTSPLAGKIVSVDVQVGQAVKDGQQVATIEAMKMNTYIYAPKAGTVSAVNAKPGDAVEEGAVLVRIG